jgi:hypothetical protein
MNIPKPIRLGRQGLAANLNAVASNVMHYVSGFAIRKMPHFEKRRKSGYELVSNLKRRDRMITAKELREATARGEGPLAKAADDEPVFLLRGQDCLAAASVERWAIQAAAMVPTCASQRMHDKVNEARLISEFMDKWHVHKTPD